VDTTGAGDALSATVMFGMLQGFGIAESLQLGLRAAALTLHSTETVVSDLSLDRLYGLRDANATLDVDSYDTYESEERGYGDYGADYDEY
jgi:hypothetical protein